MADGYIQKIAVVSIALFLPFLINIYIDISLILSHTHTHTHTNKHTHINAKKNMFPSLIVTMA